MGQYSLSFSKRGYRTKWTSPQHFTDAKDLYQLPGTTRSGWSITYTTRCDRRKSSYFDFWVSNKCELYYHKLSMCSSFGNLESCFTFAHQATQSLMVQHS